MPGNDDQNRARIARLATRLADELTRAAELQEAAAAAVPVLEGLLMPVREAGGGDPRLAVLARLARAVGLPEPETKPPSPAPVPPPEPDPAPPVGAYDYCWGLPWLPDSADELEVLPVPVTGLAARGGGDPRKLTLLVAPAATMTGKIVLRDWRSRGIVLIGFSARWAASGSRTTPKGKAIPFGHWAQISFAARSAGAVNPFLFIANGEWEAAGVQSGDWLQTGTPRVGENFDEWPDIYVQKVRIAAGHYFFSDQTFEHGTSGYLDPHADGIQVTTNRGFRRIRMANCDWRWNGQTIFARSRTAVVGRPHPEAEVSVRSCHFRAQPPCPDVYGGDGCRQPVYLAVGSDSGTDFPNGDFVLTRLEDVWAEYAASPRLRDPRRYFSPHAVSSDGDVAAWPDATFGGRRPITGTVRFGTPPKPVLDPAHCGWRHRVASFDDLVGIF